MCDVELRAKEKELHLMDPAPSCELVPYAMKEFENDREEMYPGFSVSCIDLCELLENHKLCYEKSQVRKVDLLLIDWLLDMHRLGQDDNSGHD